MKVLVIVEDPTLDRFIVKPVVERILAELQISAWGAEGKARSREADHDSLVACLAVEEVEVWMLALHRHQLEAPWRDVRRHCDPKEAYAEPFLEQKGWTTDVGRGRKRAMREIGRHWRGLLQVCPEIAPLRDRIAAVVASK